MTETEERIDLSCSIELGSKQERFDWSDYQAEALSKAGEAWVRALGGIAVDVKRKELVDVQTAA